MKIIRSVLFIDFDNVFSGFDRQDKRQVAEKFGKMPDQWVNWLNELNYMGEDEKIDRRILVKRCYLNPKIYNRYRPFFIKNAFETIDCPPLTEQGKTSADIHIVLDMLELLNHDTRFDEFILFSADADFTPLLMKLRKHDRDTVILPVGFSSPAYKASSSHVIDSDDIARLLSGDLDSAGETSISQKRENSNKNKEAILIDQISNFIISYVEGSELPIPQASLAHAIRLKFPEMKKEWGVYKEFSKLIEKANLKNVRRRVIPPRGYCFYSSIKHLDPEAERVRKLAVIQSIPSIARNVCELTNIPLLSSEQYQKALGSGLES